MQMERSTTVSGKTTFSMDMVLRFGPMEANTKETTRPDASTGSVLTCGLTGVGTPENGMRTESMDVGATSGPTDVCMTETGSKIIWMGEASTAGLMAGDMKAST